MADIKPFKAYRPAQEKVSQIAALPYDVYNRQEAATTRLKKSAMFSTSPKTSRKTRTRTC